MMYRYYRQYYRVNRRKLSLREYFRFVPGTAGVLSWLIKYPGKSIPRIVAAPSYFQDMKSDQKDFSDRCIEVLRPKFEEFHGLGFCSPCFQKIRDHLDPSTLDHGIILFLHSRGDLIGCLKYYRQKGNLEKVCLSTTSFFESGRTLEVRNTKDYFNPCHREKVYYLNSDSGSELLNFHEKKLNRYLKRDDAIPLKSYQILADIQDYEQEKKLEIRLHRGLYKTMSEKEILAAQAKSS